MTLLIFLISKVIFIRLRRNQNKQNTRGFKYLYPIFLSLILAYLVLFIYHPLILDAFDLLSGQVDFVESSSAELKSSHGILKVKDKQIKLPPLALKFETNTDYQLHYTSRLQILVDVKILDSVNVSEND